MTKLYIRLVNTFTNQAEDVKLHTGMIAHASHCFRLGLMAL
jgi:hypothetical protein